jgi:hypothetical protein
MRLKHLLEEQQQHSVAVVRQTKRVSEVVPVTEAAAAGSHVQDYG